MKITNFIKEMLYLQMHFFHKWKLPYATNAKKHTMELKI